MILNEAKFLIELGHVHVPLLTDGLAAPAIQQLYRGMSQCVDAELGGNVYVPKNNLKREV